jgi:hypothetical protein
MQEPIEINPRATKAFCMFFDVSTLWISLRPMGTLRPTQSLSVARTIGRPIHGCNLPFYPNAARQISSAKNSA